MNTIPPIRKPITIEHVTLACTRPFHEVRQAIEALVPPLDPNLIAQVSKGDLQAIAEHERNGPKLFRFLERDHGALLGVVGRACNAIQYEIGNPLTASKMTRHQLAAALYAPLRVTLFEDPDGATVFEYDLPSSLFGQFADERVRAVGLYLDEALESVLLEAAN
ncbi:DUF302 domain-containing protein [Pseudomonas machongensis]